VIELPAGFDPDSDEFEIIVLFDPSG